MKVRWSVIGFDRVTELEVEAIELPGLSDDDVRHLLDLPSTEDVTWGGYNIPPSALLQIEALLGRQLRSDLVYQIEAEEV